MSLRSFIAGKGKVVTDAGSWSDKRMPKTSGKFPLSKNKQFRVGAAGWRWRVAEVSLDGRDYRLLMTYHQAKENYVACLGLQAQEDTIVLGRLEFHSTHVGWHIHGFCKPPLAHHVGRMKHSDMVRYPDGGARHRRTSFTIDGDQAATRIAATYFNIPDLLDDGEQQGCLAFGQRDDH